MAHTHEIPQAIRFVLIVEHCTAECFDPVWLPVPRKCKYNTENFRIMRWTARQMTDLIAKTPTSTHGLCVQFPYDLRYDEHRGEMAGILEELRYRHRDFDFDVEDVNGGPFPKELLVDGVHHHARIIGKYRS